MSKQPNLDLKEGDKIRLNDNGFECVSIRTVTVHQDKKGLYIRCHHGHHYLKAGDGVLVKPKD